MERVRADLLGDVDDEAAIPADRVEAEERAGVRRDLAGGAWRPAGTPAG